MGELRAGPATSLILLGVEGAPPAELARISRSMAAALDRSGLFGLVNNGENTGFGSADQEFLFRHRYLLSSGTTAEAFTVPALHADMQRLLRLLQSSASSLVTRFGLADPTGAFLNLAQNWAGSAKIRSVGGVWFASDRDRALILAKTHASGMDLAAEEQASEAIDRAFAAAKPGDARLLASGPAIFSRDAARTIHHDVTLISIASTILVAGLLLWRFRSGWVIAAIAIPILLGFAAAALAVQLAFGFVHGVALGFGITMLGITVDYPVLLIGHRKQLEAAPATLRRIGQAFTLAVLTAAIGLTGMLFSGFPGLSQLGLFSITGILVAAATTRWLLPRLIVAADLSPVLTGDPARLLRVERLRALRGFGVAACALAGGYLLLVGGPAWEPDVAALSPVPASQLALDAELRAEIGAPDPGTVGMLHGDSAEAVLRKEEALLPVLDALQTSSAITGAEIAARFLPSIATQLARRAALPDADTLAASVAAAQAGLPFRPGAFQPFLDDVAASRTMAPVRPGEVSGKLVKARLDALLFQRPDGWYGLIAPTGVRDPARLSSAMQSAGVVMMDMGATANGIVATYTRSALTWLGLGALIALGVLLAGLRDPLRVLRVAGAIAAAALVTVALLTAWGVRMSLVTVVALQFVCGIGLDYALFFARRQLDAEERARTLRTLAICNAMAVMTFGLLALCRTPLLHDIGQTVVIGAIAALCFSFLFAGPRPGKEPV
jgi:predicted exporter